MGQNEAKIKSITLDDFSGGLNSNELSSQLKDNEFTDCQNVIYYNGSLQQVPGFIRHSAQIGGSGSTTRILGIHDFKKRDSTQHLIACAGNSIYTFNASTNKWVEVWDSAGSPLSTTALHSIVTVNNKAIGTNGTSMPWVVYDTDSDGDITDETGVFMDSFADGWSATSLCKYLCTFNDRLIALNVTIAGTTLPTSLLYSDRDSPTGWDETEQRLNFDTDDGQEITGGRQLGEKLLVFKQNSIGYVTGYGDYTFQTVRDWKKGVGCVSGYTVQTGYFQVEGVLREVVIFLSHEGYKAIDEGGNVYALPMPGQGEEYKCFEHFDGLASGSLNTAVGCFYRKRNWYFGFYRSSSGSYNDWGSIYDYNTNSLWPIKDINANCCALVYNSTAGEYEMYIGTTDGVILRMSESTKGVEDGTELVTTGSFEGIADGTAPPTGYTAYGSTTTCEADDNDTITPYQGSIQAKVVTDAVNEGIYQDITTTVGKRYRVYAYGYASAGEVQIAKEDTDASNEVTGTTVSSAAWGQMTVTFTATATTSRITLKSDTTAASTFYVDDISARCIEVDAYAISKYFDFDDEGEMKFLRELVSFVSATDTGGLTLTIDYDKGADSTNTSDTIDLTSGQINWSSEIDWSVAIDWDSYEEVDDSHTADGLTQAAFRTLRFKIENNNGSSDFQFNRIIVAVKPLGRRWFRY